MRPYETMLVFDTTVDAQQIQAALDRALDVIKNNGGVHVNTDRWGKRPLAYEIKKRKEGYYVVVEFDGVAATVEAVTLRSTRLRDFRGREMHVPNGEMKIVINHSRGWQRAVLDLPLAPGQDLARALRVSEAVVAELNNDVSWRDLLMDPFVVMGLERVGPDGAVLRVVGRARPGGDAPRLAREARLRLLQRWRDEGIQTNVEANPASRRGPEPNAPSAPSES